MSESAGVAVWLRDDDILILHYSVDVKETVTSTSHLLCKDYLLYYN